MKNIYVLEQIQDIIDIRLADEYEILNKDYYLLFLEKLKNLDMYAHRLREYEGYVHFNVAKLRTEYGYKTILGKRQWALDLVIKTLIKHDIIERTNNYSIENKKSYGYKISESIYEELALDNLKYKKEGVDTKLYNKLVKSPIPKDKELKKIYNLFKSKRVDYDLKSALNWITNELVTGNITYTKFHLYSNMAIKLKNKEIFVIRGGKGNRIFTSFNTIKRELRQFITIDNEKLVQLDLKSAQPYLFASTLYKEYNEGDTKSFYNDVINKDIYKVFLKDAQKYNGTVKEFVTHIDPITKEKTFSNEEIHINNRDEAKVEFLRFLFKKSNNGVTRPFELVFKDRYPELYSFIKNDKSRASTLQQLEASIFLPVANEYIDLGVLSVHDSLYFKESDRDTILNALTKSFEEKELKNFTLS